MRRIPLALFAAGLLLLALPAAAAALDLTRAVVVTSANLYAREKKAVTLLVEEVEKRTRIRWPVATRRASNGTPVIDVAVAPAAPAEGYRLRVTSRGASPVVTVRGNDTRGVLFGIGRLLRSMRMNPGSIGIESELDLTSAPAHRIRGHQLGNRPLNNSVDAWTVPMWEQHIRDLAVFGVNAIELIPPYAFAGEDSPHFKLPPLDMMTEVSRLLDEYGLDVWIWYPALEKDYSDPAKRDAAVAACAEVFARLPRIDAVFVPGGDPGQTHPRHLMPYLERLSQALRRHHPKAGVWMSPQGFDEAWLAELLRDLKAGPAWLAGIVYGPGVRVGPAQLRAGVPARYPIRLYTDITHTVRSEYPVPNWDLAFALTYDREPINPRPVAQAEIFRNLRRHAVGSITYSDGVNDDVNKIVWSVLGWNSDTPVTDIVREYGRYFIGDGYADDFAEGLLALERNWKGSLSENHEVPTTLKRFQAIERSASPDLLSNWRFQQGLYRAYYDDYVRTRLMHETRREAQAIGYLAGAIKTGSMTAIAQAEAALDDATSFPPWRTRLYDLAAALYKNIGMQLSFDLYHANRRRRAASLDTMDFPLNDRGWLKKRFAEIRQLPSEPDRLREIDVIVNWKNPGPGGFYNDLGNPDRQPHLVVEPESAPTSVSWQEEWPLAWATYASSSRRAPIKMRYTGLDPKARYKVRTVYAGDNISQEQGIRLMAGGNIVVHPYMQKPLPVRPVEFDVPAEATRDGELVLTWDREPTPSGRSRGAQVAEVWLIKK